MAELSFKHSSTNCACKRTSVKRTLTWGKGQQAHSPKSVLQQVVPPGHIVCLSHFSSCSSELRAGTFSTQRREGRKPNGSSQLSASRLQTVPWGQQWMWSLQHTACSNTAPPLLQIQLGSSSHTAEIWEIWWRIFYSRTNKEMCHRLHVRCCSPSQQLMCNENNSIGFKIKD